MELPDDVAHALRRLKHGGCLHQRLGLAGRGILPTLPQDADHRLADGEISRRGDRHDALVRSGENVELAEGRDVVDTGIGAGVREHHETVAHQDATAISHDLRRAPAMRPYIPMPAANRQCSTLDLVRRLLDADLGRDLLTGAAVARTA